MDWKLELVFVPVSDVDRAKDFYVNKVGFNADFDERPSSSIRFVQLTPPVSDIQAAHRQLKANGVDVSDVDVQDWGHFVYFADPDGNRWAVQYIPGRDVPDRQGEAASV
jgi:predicted enzyme related to lactoylglutathione lyase